jgi:hypothetical protein
LIRAQVRAIDRTIGHVSPFLRARKPGSGDRPVPLHRGRRYAERVGSLLDRQAAEEAQLDDASLLGVEPGQLREGTVERDQIT